MTWTKCNLWRQYTIFTSRLFLFCFIINLFTAKPHKGKLTFKLSVYKYRNDVEWWNKKNRQKLDLEYKTCFITLKSELLWGQHVTIKYRWRLVTIKYRWRLAVSVLIFGHALYTGGIGSTDCKHLIIHVNKNKLGKRATCDTFRINWLFLWLFSFYIYFVCIKNNRLSIGLSDYVST